MGAVGSLLVKIIGNPSLIGVALICFIGGWGYRYADFMFRGQVISEEES